MFYVKKPHSDMFSEKITDFFFDKEEPTRKQKKRFFIVFFLFFLVFILNFLLCIHPLGACEEIEHRNEILCKKIEHGAGNNWICRQCGWSNKMWEMCCGNCGRWR